jgi:hypothetical protein
LRAIKFPRRSFGVGDDPRSYKTPLGAMFVCNKIGGNLPPGAVIHGRAFTGEVLRPDAPGRDPIVSRVIWLRGIESQNRRAYDRCIYIHGTAEEKNVGRAVSFGCIRMKSKDVIALYDLVRIGTRVTISDQKLKRAVADEEKGATLGEQLTVRSRLGLRAFQNRRRDEPQKLALPACGIAFDARDARLRHAHVCAGEMPYQHAEIRLVTDEHHVALRVFFQHRRQLLLIKARLQRALHAQIDAEPLRNNLRRLQRARQRACEDRPRLHSGAAQKLRDAPRLLLAFPCQRPLVVRIFPFRPVRIRVSQEINLHRMD